MLSQRGVDILHLNLQDGQMEDTVTTSWEENLFHGFDKEVEKREVTG